MDTIETPATQQRKIKLMFGIKGKKKKKVNSDVVLENKAALDSKEGLYCEASPMLKGESDEDQHGFSAIRTRIMPNIKRSKLNTHLHNSEGKPQSFQIAINITEARQLVGENIDPIVVIEIGDEKKQTTVKEGTNAPFYNEYFVFDFFAHKEIFFDKVIKLTVMHSKMLRSFCVGSFKLDVWTVYKQPGHHFINKWAMLSVPGDIRTGCKGYIKCDISVSAKGDAMQPGLKTSEAEEQIEKNLLIPEGFPSERPWARFSVRVYRAEGLPRNNSSIMANVTKAFIGDNTALIDPYVVVSFFKQVGRTSTQKSNADPVWNEQIVFTEMFPPLCQRIKIQIWDEGSMSDVAIGTHYFDLRRISNEQDGDRGFLPTFGPAWIHFYGSVRNSLGDDTVELNEGIGEGVAFRGRVFLELVVEILSGGTGPVSKISHMVKPVKDTKVVKTGGKDLKTPATGGVGGGSSGGIDDDDKGKAVAEVQPVESPPTLNTEKREKFLLFGALFEATLIDRKIGDKPITFEFSLGNCGNVQEPAVQPSLSAPSPSHSRRRQGLDFTERACPSSPLLPSEPQDPSRSSNSITVPQKPIPVAGNRYYMYLPLEKQKPCINVLSQWEDRTYRLYNSNMLENIVFLLEEGVTRATELHKKSFPGVEETLKTTVNAFCMSARRFIATVEGQLKAHVKSNHLTQLDMKRLSMCKQELESMIEDAQSLVSRKRKSGGVKEELQDATKLTHKLRFLVEEPQHTVPDIFVWMLSNNKRIAYARLSARDVIFCSRTEACGVHCGKILTLFLKPPGKHMTGFSVQAKVDVYLWFGSCVDFDHTLDNLPVGFNTATWGTLSNPPTQLTCAEQHEFLLRCHLYQARGLIAADSSGLSDPFVRVTYLSQSQTTKVISQTLSPTWNQCLQMSPIVLSGDLQYIQNEPPRLVIEVYDDDALGKAEYLGATVASPKVFLLSDPYMPPMLQYSSLHHASQLGGELLSAFELVQIPKSGELSLPLLKEQERGVYALPDNIRPVLSTYRLEVLFWGLRELKKVQLLSVDRPQVFIECAGKTLRSSVIHRYKSDPNFTRLVDTMEMELPENEHLHPPLSITVVDWRAFGRSTLVGTHVINNLMTLKYIAPLAQPAPALPAAMSMPGPQGDGNSQEKLKLEISSNVTSTPDIVITVEQSTLEKTTPTSNKESRKKSNRRSTKRRRRTIADESAECVIDWWSKYYASLDKETNQTENSPFPQVFEKVSSSLDGNKKKKQKGKEMQEQNQNLSLRSKLATLQLYNNELEAEFGPFDDWVNTYELFRGKSNEEESSTEEQFVGKFKGAFCLYRIDEDEGPWEEDDGRLRVNRGIPPNTPFQVLIRVYIVAASNLHPADLDGKADPYIVVQLGKNEIKDRENYIPKQLNPVFGRSFEMQATFPQESLLSVLIYDYDMVGGDDLIGETRIDLENRFYSRHRATCGLPTEYSLEGYNAWRDCLKPSELLTKLCRENNLDGPNFSPGRITVANNVFTGKTIFMHEDEEPMESYEDLSLKILHRWSEIHTIGCKLVPEHIETRTLFNKARPGMDQGQVQMWVDMFPMDLPYPGPAVDISPRKPKGYELRVIIWNTEDVVLEDSNFLTGQRSSDIYIKGWLKGLEDDCQETDVHYNSLTGEGNFNWRFVFPFNYLPAEKVMVVKKRDSIFSLDKSEQKLPAILSLQVWDFDTLSSDDFLGTVELDLHCFPRGTKTAKSCKGDVFTDGTERISIFQQKRSRGWWPFNKSGELMGKVEAEFHLVMAEETGKNSVGRGRREPEPLPKPNRPDTSFSWFVNPFKCFFHLVWRNYKKYIIIGTVLLVTALFLVLLLYTLPGAISQKLVNG
ncbi:fer-1-like protein 6 isoform X1 [Stigmatopora nigra]